MIISWESDLLTEMLARHTDVVDEAFIEERVRAAVEYRFDTVDTSACRLIFGEADFLPGLVIDKYSDVLVVESLALGIDRFKSLIVEKVKEILHEKGIDIRGVYERSDAKVRTLEGMERVKGFIGDEFDTNVEIVENGVHYMIDVVNGQKTGFFLDQKYNRLAMQKLGKLQDLIYLNMLLNRREPMQSLTDLRIQYILNVQMYWTSYQSLMKQVRNMTL